MSSHRPKSLSELNNVYDKALRAEKAIKENSSLLSTHETTEPVPGENIFAQLETKAAEAKKNQVFDPDITNIASDFLKRYAQPEKPKPAPKEIKRPAPTIQSVQPHIRKSKPEVKAEVALPQDSIPSDTKAANVPLHRPAHQVPSTDTFVTAPQTVVSEESKVPAYAEPTEAPAAEVSVTEAPAPKAPVRTEPARRVDHTPRPAPSRVRITSSERSELMEEYMRVMSDDDDEPSEKKSVFSFFRKKKHSDYEEPVESIYEDLNEEEDSAPDQVPVVAFGSSDVKYEDEYSDTPVSEGTAVTSSPMNLYDYIEADFDYDEDEDGTLDISSTTFEKENVDTEEYYGETEPEEGTYPTEPEEGTYLTEPEEEVIYPEEMAEEAEEIIPTEEIVPAEEVTEEAVEEEAEDAAPPAEMEFEDIFSVSDENKRSHTGGDWGGTVPPEALPSYESEEAYSEEDSDYDSYDEYDDEDDEEEEYYEKKKGNVFLKIMLIFFAVISLAFGAATAATDLLLDIDNGELISDRYRLFCAGEDTSSLDISKGDLIITENVYAHQDDVYVFSYSDDNTYRVGKVKSNTSTLVGEYIYVTESGADTLLINRDMSMGVVIASYGSLGTVLSIVCSYGIFMTIAFVLIAIGLIVLLIIISKKKARPEYYDDDTTEDGNDDDYGDGPEENDDDEEYYSEYDTDGIEQGLFSGI